MQKQKGQLNNEEHLYNVNNSEYRVTASLWKQDMRDIVKHPINRSVYSV